MQSIWGDQMPATVRTLLLAPFILALGAVAASARTIDDVKLDPQVVASRCTRIRGEFGISMQARIFYANVEKSPPVLSKPPTRKTFESFTCGGSKSTLYYYEYANATELGRAKSFAEGQIWGAGGPTKEHPELIIAIDNVLVVISSRQPEFFKKHLEKQES
jgi:hypothetical protein